jgi:hypothetical protein
LFIMAATAPIPLPTAGNNANVDWIEAHWAQLLCDYPDQWVAVDQGRVWASGRNLGLVTDEAQRAGASTDVVHQFVASATTIL